MEWAAAQRHAPASLIQPFVAKRLRNDRIHSFSIRDKGLKSGSNLGIAELCKVTAQIDAEPHGFPQS
jgi:hypothetical protein